MARWIGRENVRKRLEALDEGRTTYAAGAVTFETADETIVVRPPFGLSHEGSYDSIAVEPLLEELFRDRVVAAVLVRLGGFAVGVFEGERLVASKVGSRFVKGRHKKGGSSSGRFRRRREEQARALIDAAAETAVACARAVAPEDRARRARRRPAGDRLAARGRAARLAREKGGSRASSRPRIRGSERSSGCRTTSTRPRSRRSL